MKDLQALSFEINNISSRYKLDNKYSSFKVLNLEDAKVYMDDKTKCYLAITGNGSMWLYMRYKDKQLSDEMEAENDSEL